jgi:DNA-binding GntR family transcriptional regulator
MIRAQVTHDPSATTLRTLRHVPSLTQRAADDLRRAIVQGAYDESGRLPAEPELARQLGVSRTTLRHAISALQDEGLVHRRQGSGTFVIRRGAELRNNLNINFGVTDLIEAAGWTPGTRNLRTSTVAASPVVAGKLGIPPRAPVVMVTRTRTADDRPVARTTDYLPAQALAELQVDVEDLIAHGSLYRGLEAAGLVVHHGILEIRATRADRATSAELSIRPGALLLSLDQVDYTADGDAIVASHELYVADALTVQVYRKGSGLRL